ncbi:response regulator [Pseudomaricurvus alcaniphilus]|uniref:response regulator n=1 Tax=Pseudomaricurvus alcaniphilus TaxID=1166482 RepID=UPI0014098471|nr:response regulator transcription factor [Pseudomaricurvus alcaniphilus]NHN36255.1 response regulator [Pseudomaricurvus alcaniphilus]
MVKVHIAEDSDIIRRRLVHLVKEVDGVCSVLESDNYASTLAMIQSEEPQVLVLDLFMPGGTGIDVLNELRGMEQSPRVIVLTASADIDFQIRCLEAGADYFFSKTADFLQAIEVVRELVSVSHCSHCEE